jgi:hypothetical protein
VQALKAPTDESSGSYSYTFQSLPLGKYRIAVSAEGAGGTLSPVVARIISVKSDGTSSGGGEPPAPTGTTYASIMMGRAAYQAAEDCVPYAEAVSLERAIQWMSERGVPAVTGVVPKYTSATDQRQCQGYVLYPSWDDHKRFSELYGTVPVSQSQSYDSWAHLSTADQFRAESCGSLAEFENKGFSKAWGMFNYPNNFQPDISRTVVDDCFAFGRKYAYPTSTRESAMTAPHVMNTYSVTSGACNNPDLPCYSLGVKNNRRYMLPSKVIPYLNQTGDRYGVIQFYRFISGSRLAGSGVTWDCTSPDERDHFVTQPELYCFNDFQAILQARGSHVVFTDPATVATAWGRSSQIGR